MHTCTHTHTHTHTLTHTHTHTHSLTLTLTHTLTHTHTHMAEGHLQYGSPNMPKPFKYVAPPAWEPPLQMQVCTCRYAHTYGRVSAYF